MEIITNKKNFKVRRIITKVVRGENTTEFLAENEDLALKEIQDNLKSSMYNCNLAYTGCVINNFDTVLSQEEKLIIEEIK